MCDVDNEHQKVYRFNVKLCAAVKSHKCLHDPIATNKNTPPECEKAWELVGKECEESAEYCKLRWKALRKSFFRSLSGRRTNKYYMHEFMEFLIRRDKNKDESNKDQTVNNNSICNTENQQNEKVKNSNQNENESGASDFAGEKVAESDTTIADECNECRIPKHRIPRDTGESGEVTNNIPTNIDEDDDASAENRHRSRYSRACKRGLDPDLINELSDEKEKQDEKRPRRKSISGLSLNEFNNQMSPTSLPLKKMEIKINKLKMNKSPNVNNHNNKTAAESADQNLKRTINETEGTFISVRKNLFNKKADEVEAVTQIHKSFKKPKMVDNSDTVKRQTRNAATQCETMQESIEFDEMFINSIKPQLKLMNGRQKLNFKRKVYQSLMEVFDDASDFPNAEDYIEPPPAGTPRLFSTTTGELRLMRELVSLVQAAKTTPEIVNDSEKTTNKPTTPTTVCTTAITENHSNQAETPIFIDDDDSILSKGNLDNSEDVCLSRPFEKSIVNRPDDGKATGTENVLGLSRRVIQKVVKVSGSNGSTIVTRDGDKKRIYRIYPKMITPIAPRSVPNKGTSSSNMGTFYVTPPKNTTDAPQNNLCKNMNNSPNITFRPVGSKPSSTSSGTTLTVNNLTYNNSIVTKNPTVYKSLQPGNKILNAATGHFNAVSPTSTFHLPPANNKTTLHGTTITTAMTTTTTTLSSAATVMKPTSPNFIPVKNQMLPPNINVTHTNNGSVKGPVVIRSNTNGPPIIQRRYSICADVATKNSPKVTITQPRDFVVVNGNPAKPSISQVNNTVNSSTANAKVTGSVTAMMSTSKSHETSTTPVLSTQQFIQNGTTISRVAENQAADPLDPLFIKEHIKTEPLDD